MLLSFKVKFVLYLSCEKNGNKQKEAGFGPFSKKEIKFEVSRLKFDRMAFLLTCVFFHELPISDLLNIDLILMSGAGPVEFDVRHQI